MACIRGIQQWLHVKTTQEQEQEHYSWESTRWRTPWGWASDTPAKNALQRTRMAYGSPSTDIPSVQAVRKVLLVVWRVHDYQETTIPQVTGAWPLRMLLPVRNHSEKAGKMTLTFCKTTHPPRVMAIVLNNLPHFFNTISGTICERTHLSLPSSSIIITHLLAWSVSKYHLISPTLFSTLSTPNLLRGLNLGLGYSATLDLVHDQV